MSETARVFFFNHSHIKKKIPRQRCMMVLNEYGGQVRNWEISYHNHKIINNKSWLVYSVCCPIDKRKALPYRQAQGALQMTGGVRTKQKDVGV